MTRHKEQPLYNQVVHQELVYCRQIPHPSWTQLNPQQNPLVARNQYLQYEG